jgi:diguanylate cyclase (GGDEF)-like protein/PAS domain S-box-containing protein
VSTNYNPIEELRSQVENFERQLSDPDINDPQTLQQFLVEAVSGLMRVLESVQEQPEGSAESRPSEGDLRESVQNILRALERSQHKLQESEARYRAIVESQVEVICRFSADGNLTFFNEAFRRYFGAYTEITPGINIYNLLPDDQREIVKGHVARITPTNKMISVEFSLPLPTGEQHWQQWTGLGNFDEQGNLTEVQAVGQDITIRKQAEVTARQHNRELSSLHAATAALLTTLDPEALLSRILDSAISAIPAASKGMIHLIAQDTGQLEMRASVGYTDPRIRRIRIPSAVGYVARSVRERTPLLIHNIHADPANVAGLYPEIQDVQSAVVAPLVIKGQVVGALSLESTQLSAFNESDLRLLASFAATATASIQNARLHAEVQKLAITDSLTGLYNRRGLFELGQREVERSRRYKRPLVAIMMDVDHFKFINDYYGHTVGDQVLQAVAKRCTDNLRRIDILGRLGGDEFTFLLPETDMFTASHVAERVRQTVAERPIVTDETPINVSASLGVARATSATPDLEVLISRADAAMYVAKREGRNRVEFG